jgi:hypothetical protein
VAENLGIASIRQDQGELSMKRNMATWQSLGYALLAGILLSSLHQPAMAQDDQSVMVPPSETDSVTVPETYGGIVEGEMADEAGMIVGGAGCRPWQYGQPNLFYNYYVPNNCGGVPAQLYLAPRPVPPLVGHVYYTYQPLMPHEMMYKHSRTYRSYYDDGRGITRTHVRWTYNPLTVALQSARETVRLAR